jgi:hypothetical protein
MKMCWKRFLLSRLPCSALVLALAVQGIAFGLSGVPILRGRPDELALAVLKDPANYRVLLFGDSITRIATTRFALGPPGEIGNLATDRYVGLVGSLFLLQRYLSAHDRPERVVVVLAPSLYELGDDIGIARDNLWLTFNRPDERDFLRTYIPGIEWRDWLPAVLNVWERLVYPFSSYLIAQYLTLRIEAGSRSAKADAAVEFAPRAEVEKEAFDHIRRAGLSPMNAEALRRLCNLGKSHGFRIDIAWPPLPAQLRTMLTSSGALAELESGIGSIMEGDCDFGGFVDFNEVRTYPDKAFRNDLAHLFGDGWEQRYAADLREYLTDARRMRKENAIGGGRSLPGRPAAGFGSAVR